MISDEVSWSPSTWFASFLHHAWWLRAVAVLGRLRVFNLDKRLDFYFKIGLFHLVQLMLCHHILICLFLLLIIGQEIVKVLVIIIIIEAHKRSFPFHAQALSHALFLHDLTGDFRFLARCEVHNVELIVWRVLLLFYDRIMLDCHQVLKLVFLLHLTRHSDLLFAIIYPIVILITIFIVIFCLIFITAFFALISSITLRIGLLV